MSLRYLNSQTIEFVDVNGNSIIHTEMDPDFVAMSTRISEISVQTSLNNQARANYENMVSKAQAAINDGRMYEPLPEQPKQLVYPEDFRMIPVSMPWNPPLATVKTGTPSTNHGNSGPLPNGIADSAAAVVERKAPAVPVAAPSDTFGDFMKIFGTVMAVAGPSLMPTLMDLLKAALTHHDAVSVPKS
jgi:hypothetical protein